MASRKVWRSSAVHTRRGSFPGSRGSLAFSAGFDGQDAVDHHRVVEGLAQGAVDMTDGRYRQRLAVAPSALHEVGVELRQRGRTKTLQTAGADVRDHVPPEVIAVAGPGLGLD